MMTHVWMALDPETLRVLIQPQDFSEGDFPLGLRGTGWPTREGEIDDEIWQSILRAEIPPVEQDQIHRDLWSQYGEPWPAPLEIGDNNDI